MEKRRDGYRVLFGKPERKRLLDMIKRRLENNIKMHLHEFGCGSMDWIDLAQDKDRWQAVVKAVMSIPVS
jgi:hypothetical protein